MIAWRGGAKYVLLRADAKGSLTHEAARPEWTVLARTPYMDPISGLVMPFSLDKAGGEIMKQLTSGNIGHSMAVLVDNRAVMAANIASTIVDRGVITFGAVDQSHPLSVIRQQAERLQRLVSQGEGPMTYQVLP
jgi:preprotein translocase subunit SecD